MATSTGCWSSTLPSSRLALQVGGSEPDLMAKAAELAERWGYAEVNVNVGCPSRPGPSQVGLVPA